MGRSSDFPKNYWEGKKRLCRFPGKILTNFSSGFKIKKAAVPFGTTAFLMCWRTPIFPGRHQPSIFGTNELNFRVRDGNGWTLAVINTNFSCPHRTAYWVYHSLLKNASFFSKKFPVFSGCGFLEPVVSFFLEICNVSGKSLSNGWKGRSCGRLWKKGKK